MRIDTLDAKTKLAVYIIHFWQMHYHSTTPSGERATSLLDARTYLEPRLQGDQAPSGNSLRDALVWWGIQVNPATREELLAEYNSVHAFA